MTPQLGNVYYFQSANEWDFGLFRGKPTGEVHFVKEMNKYIYVFKGVDRIIETNEIEIEPEYYSEFRAFEDMIFPTYEQLKSEIHKRHEERVKEYYDSIKNLHDLMKFPLDNCISCAEEYTNWIAREAYIKRAKEFGLEYDE